MWSNFQMITRCAGESKKAFEMRYSLLMEKWGDFTLVKAHDLPGEYVRRFEDGEIIAYVNRDR